MVGIEIAGIILVCVFVPIFLGLWLWELSGWLRERRQLQEDPIQLTQV
jgi:hypothetical protein